MNILVVCHEYPPLGGGGGVGAQQYAEAWAAKGHRVTVLTSRVPGLAGRETVQGVDVVRAPVAGLKKRATVSFLSMLSFVVSAFFLVLFSRTRFAETDVINTHFSVPNGPLGFALSKLLGAPNLLTIIGGDIYDPTKGSSPHRRPVTRLLNSLVINAADQIVAISSDTKARAQHYYAIRKPIDVINYGFIPFELPQNPSVNLTRTNGEYYLIAVGRLVARKGFAHLIAALASTPDNVKLLLIGDGPLEGALRRQARRSGVAERVEFLGYQQRTAIYEYLLSADCFVLSSLHEGMGIVVQEAMYAGLPVVATNVGGQVDLIEEAHNGLLVEPENAAMLATAIRRLHEEDELRRRVAQNNAQDIEQYFIATNCEQYLTHFTRLTERFSMPAPVGWQMNSASRRVQ